MKCAISLASVLVLFVASAIFAEDAPNLKDVGDLDRDAAVKAFAKLVENAKQGLSGPNAVVKSEDGTTKFAPIAPVEVPLVSGGAPVTNVTNAIKVWFELSNGRFVNPKLYRWAPNEVFYVHVLTAVPVYVTIYQNYPGISESKRAYPDERFPLSYRVVRPGEPTRLPVAFQMDGNHNTEYMSIVVSKADWEGVRVEAPQSVSVAVAVAQAGSTQAVAAAYAGVVKGGADISKDSTLSKFAAVNEAGLADKEYEDGATKCRRVRYYTSYPVYVRPAFYCRYVNRVYTYVPVTHVTNVVYVNYRACYTNIDDAAIYLFSDSGVGQLQISLGKCGPHWHW